MLTVAEAAVRARVSESTMRGWIRDGVLPHYRMGAKGKRGKIAIAVEDLDGLVASFKVGRKEPEPTKAPAPKKPHPTFRHLNFR